MKVNKSKLNLIIDIIMFVVMVLIAGIGFMMKYILVPGFKRNEIYGQDVELYFWGMDRHQWGQIHFILSISLLVLLLLHIIFHWNMIICIFKRMVPIKPVRLGLTACLVIFTFVFAVVPLFVQPDVQKAEGHHSNQKSNYKDRQQNTQITSELKTNEKYDAETDISKENKDQKDYSRHKSNQEKEHNHNNTKTIEIYGSMTINEVSKKYNIPASELSACINVPEKYSDERLGRLRKQYNFHMDDLRKYIESKNNKQ